MIRISVIIPVYNVEDYIEEALDSIINQTMFDDLEVIMVDDGSTDDSRYIIDEYARNYDNFYAYHKKNEGQGIARNFGLEYARGEYIHFMDADDYLPPKAYETLYYFNPYNDFIVGNLLKFGEFNIWENILFKEAFSSFHDDVKSFRLEDVPNILWDTITCNKLFKKSFLDKYHIRFINRNTYYEDLLFSLEAYIYASSIGFSMNIFYFWRLRKDKTSITQKQEDVRNFQNRLEVLKIYNNLMNKHELSSRYTDVVYDKWLRHDLKTSLKKIGNYPGKYYLDLIKNTNDILRIIPDYLKEDLPNYLKIVYSMVNNYDISSLLLFAHLYEDYKKDPLMKLPIHEDYLKLVDTSYDGENENFTAHITDVTYDDKKIVFEFEENLENIPNNVAHNILVSLINKNDETSLKVRNNRFYLPLNLIENHNHLKIKVTYTKSVKKEVLLKNYNRKSLRFDTFDVDLGIGINNILYIDIAKRNNNSIIIRDISLDDDEFIFSCESLHKINNLTLTNFVTYKKKTYPVIHAKDETKFIFIIPYDDFTRDVIRKYELNSSQSLNSIKLANEFKFIYGNSQITFKNLRNKIYINNKTSSNSVTDVEEIITKNEQLVDENNKLNTANASLNKNLEEFKSRRVVKLADNVKNIFKK